MTIENGQGLIDAARAWLRRYVALTPAEELVMVLWCFHTWCYEQLGRTTPYVEITGASGSGKTTLMEACSILSRGGEILNTLRTLYICRRINETNGEITIFIDEAEKLAGTSYGDQRSMLASGYREGGVHGVSVGKGTIRFGSYCPKMFTSTRTMVNVLHNRSIPIWMERAGGRVEASLSREWSRAEATGMELRQAFQRISGPWLNQARAARAAAELRKMGVDVAAPVVDGAVHVLTMEASHLSEERDQEIWTPLFSLARTLGVEDKTIAELTAASVDISARRGVDRRCDVKDADEGARERSYAVRLAQDAKAVALPGESFIPTDTLVERLHALPASPWRVYGGGGLTSISLAQLLGVFGVEPGVSQIGSGRKERKQVRGYKVSAIAGIKL
jgi:uncharacterized protein DUF3631